MSTTAPPPTVSTLTPTAQRGPGPRGTRLTLGQRLAAAVRDIRFLRVQHTVHAAGPRLTAHLDELARCRDGRRRTRP